MAKSSAPWRIKRNPVRVAIYDAFGRCVAEGIHEIEDATLIVAAPELEAMLSELADEYEQLFHDVVNKDTAPQIVAKARAVLAKARRLQPQPRLTDRLLGELRQGKPS